MPSETLDFHWLWKPQHRDRSRELTFPTFRVRLGATSVSGTFQNSLPAKGMAFSNGLSLSKITRPYRPHALEPRHGSNAGPMQSENGKDPIHFDGSRENWWNGSPQAPFHAFALRTPHKSSNSLWLAFSIFLPFNPSLSLRFPYEQVSVQHHSFAATVQRGPFLVSFHTPSNNQLSTRRQTQSLHNTITMHYATISGAAVLLALAPSVMAQMGSATLVNSCGYDIYYAPTSGSFEGMVALSPGGTYSTPYDEQNQGVSIKVAPTNDLGGAITQFEFTWAGESIFYDISNINGNPFSSAGMSLTPSVENDPSNPTCTQVDCPAVSSGDSVCAAAYNQPDDTATKVCSQTTSLTMVICSGGSSAPASSPSSAPASTPSNGTWPPKRDTSPANLHSHHRAHMRHFPRK